MKYTRAGAELTFTLLWVAALSAAPRQLPDFRMAAHVEHFDITCAPELDRHAAVIGRQAENAYLRVSSSLAHDLSFRPLLVLFATRTEQMRAIDTRTVPGNREHVLVALDAPDTALDGQLTHDLSHVFLFDLVPATRHRDIPVWILEGLAEHQRGEWDEADRILLTNMVATGTVPKLSRVDTLEGDFRKNVVFGHTAFDFLAARHGTAGLRRFLIRLRESTPISAFLGAVDLSPVDFDAELDAYLNVRF